MEDEKPDDKRNKGENDDFMKCIKGLKQKATIPNLPKNKKYKKNF